MYEKLADLEDEKIYIAMIAQYPRMLRQIKFCSDGDQEGSFTIIINHPLE